MKRKKGKPSISSDVILLPEVSEKFETRQNESHQMTLNRPFGMEYEQEDKSSISIEYHLTIQLTNGSLTRRELSLLLDILNYQALHFGVNFIMALSMYELYFRLLGQKRFSSEISEPRIRLTVTLTELILKLLKDFDFSLHQKQFAMIDPKVKEMAIRLGALMSQRTYGSRYKTYRPEKFLKVRIVPVDIQFLKRNDKSSRYDSYCKGYGESHPSAHRSRLKPSSETDGSGESPHEIEDRKIFNRCTDPIHLLSEFLLIWYENRKEEEK